MHQKSLKSLHAQVAKLKNMNRVHMTIADTLIKKILAEALTPHREESFSADEAPIDDLLPPSFFADVPDLEVFQQRDSDSNSEFPEQPSSLAVLGTYQWMASPGVITLYRGNIEAYWKSLLKHAYPHFPFITTEDARSVLTLLINSVYQHERFHYVCDFSRRLLGSSFDRWHEEALAVAHEWQCLRAQGGNTIYGRLHPALRRRIVQSMFDHRSAGYRDWRHFASQQDFHAAVTRYLYPASTQTFAGTTFNFAAWIVKHVPDGGNCAWEERIAP